MCVKCACTCACVGPKQQPCLFSYGWIQKVEVEIHGTVSHLSPSENAVALRPPKNWEARRGVLTSRHAHTFGIVSHVPFPQCVSEARRPRGVKERISSGRQRRERTFTLSAPRFTWHKTVTEKSTRHLHVQMAKTTQRHARTHTLTQSNSGCQK